MNKIKYLCLNLFYIGVLLHASLEAQTGVQKLTPLQEGWTFYTSSLTNETHTITWATRYKSNNKFEIYEVYAPKLKNLSSCQDLVIQQNNPSDKEELFLKCRDINQNDYIVSLRNESYQHAIRDLDTLNRINASETQTMSWQDKLYHYGFKQLTAQENNKGGLRKVFKRAFVSPHYESKHLDVFFVVDIDQAQGTEKLQTILVSFAQYRQNKAGQLLQKPLSFSFVKAIPGRRFHSPSLLFSTENYMFEFSIDSSVVQPVGFTQKGLERSQDELKSFVKSEINQRTLDLSFIDNDEKNKPGSTYMAALSQLYFDLNYTFFEKHWQEHRSNTLYSSVMDNDLEKIWLEFNGKYFLLSRSTQRHMETMHRNNDKLRASAMSYGIRPAVDLKTVTGFTLAEMYAGLFWGDQYDQSSRVYQKPNYLNGSRGYDFYWRRQDFDQTQYIDLIGLKDASSTQQLINFFRSAIDE